MVLALSYARIHRQSLVNFGVLPLEFQDDADYSAVETGDVLRIGGLTDLTPGNDVTVLKPTQDSEYTASHRLCPRQLEIVAAGGPIPWLRRQSSGDQQK